MNLIPSREVTATITANGVLTVWGLEPVPVVVDPEWMACPALAELPAPEHRERLARAIDGIVGRHDVLAVPFGTDASSIAEAGIPAVVFGPGDIAQAHTKDEWIELDQIDRAAEILYRFAAG